HSQDGDVVRNLNRANGRWVVNTDLECIGCAESSRVSGANNKVEACAEVIFLREEKNRELCFAAVVINSRIEEVRWRKQLIRYDASASHSANRLHWEKYCNARIHHRRDVGRHKVRLCPRK